MSIDEAERERRRRLMATHLDAENAHDLAAIMATFSANPENRFDSTNFYGLEAIARGHESIGMSDATPGALENLRVVIDKEYFTEKGIIVRGRLQGKHVRNLSGVAPPTNAEISMPFYTEYRFDADDKVSYERVVMNLSPLGKPE
jgi:hypothetical protein